MGKLWKDFVKKCYEQTLYTAQLILDYKDTATIIVVENNNPEYEELKKKAVAAKSDILPVFKDGILISYERDVKHENFEIMPGVQQAQTYTSYSSLVYYYESSIDNDVVSNRFEVLCVEFGMMGDDDMVANTNGEIIFDVIKKGCTNIQKDKNKKMIGLILAGYSSVIEIPGCVGISIYGRGSYEFTYPPDRNYSDNFNISTKYGSIPATYLAQKDLSQDEVIEMLEKTFIYIKEDELLIVRSIMEMYMRSTNYLIDHPEEKARKKKATKTSSVVQESRSPDSKSDKANTSPNAQVFSLNTIRFKSTNTRASKILTSRKYERIADCWDVRGHYRHYKSGKTVFIAPYEKGKDRNNGANKAGKTYLFGTHDTNA